MRLISWTLRSGNEQVVLRQVIFRPAVLWQDIICQVVLWQLLFDRSFYDRIEFDRLFRSRILSEVRFPAGCVFYNLRFTTSTLFFKKQKLPGRNI